MHMLATQGAAVMLIGTPEVARRVFHWHSRYVAATDNTPAAKIPTFDNVEQVDDDEQMDAKTLACLRRDRCDRLALVWWRVSALPSLDQLQLCEALRRLDGETQAGTGAENVNGGSLLNVQTGAILRQLTGSFSHHGLVQVFSQCS